MPAVPSNVRAKDAVKAFGKFGFQFDRKRGSHIILVKPDYEFVLTVPSHAGRDLKKGTLRSLIKTAGITVQDFIDAL